MEAVAKEVAPFGIECTIVEPGANPTNFAGGIVSPHANDAYNETPVGDIRRAIAAGAFPIPGDATKTGQAMIDSVDRQAAP